MKREPCRGGTRQSTGWNSARLKQPNELRRPDGARPFRAQDSLLPIPWASARHARFSPGYNIAGLQPSESAYDLSHLGKAFDEVPDKVPDKGQQWLTPLTKRVQRGIGRTCNETTGI